MKLAFKICGDYGYPYRMFTKADKKVLPSKTPMIALRFAAFMGKYWAKKYNVPALDYLLFPDWGAPEIKACKKYSEYRKVILDIWADIPDGVTETFVHPSIESDELKVITNNWKQRVWEYTLMKDPETEKYLNEHGVKLISYKELKQEKL